MQDTVVRPWRPADGEAVAGLLQQVWGEDEQGRRYARPGEKALHTWVAEQNGRLIGVGSVWANRFHPYTQYTMVQVHPADRGRGTGQRLLDELRRAAGGALPWQTSTREGRAERFLARNGFAEIRRTYRPRLPVALCDWACAGGETVPAGLPAGLPGGLHLVNLADSAHRNSDLAALCRTLYLATHQANPPGEFPLAEWERLAFGDLVAAGSFAALDRDRYVAVALLHPGEAESTLDLGWRGAAPGTGPDVVRALTLRQVAYAAGSGVRYLQAEIDTTDPWAMAMLEYLPFGPAPAWVTYRT